MAEKKYYRTANGYMCASDGCFEHRDVWAKINGPIPRFHQIHHKNRIRHDNRIENLECLNASEHLKLHGLRWDSIQKRVALAFVPKETECPGCGKAFMTESFQQKFCCRKCMSDTHNRNLAEQRTKQRAEARGELHCPTCGIEFAPKKLGAKFCGRRCASIAAKRAYNKRIGHQPTPSFRRV
jgi:endogenous inhibitor of DNA gyrase (YacG/DUF329 family)